MGQDLGRGLEAGEISSRELVGEALKRAREQKALFNAIAGTRDVAALSEAEESDRRRAKDSTGDHHSASSRMPPPPALKKIRTYLRISL